MNTPTVSVVVPVYMAEKYLGECIQSILGQTFTDFELILVDDGSADNSALICDAYAREDKRIRVIHQENRGVSAARNAGIDACLGDYIVFVDSDDTVAPDFLETAVNSIRDTQADVYVSGLQMETWQGEQIIQTVSYGINEPNFYTIRELMENMNVSYPQICICGPWCKLYKKEIIQTNQVRFPEQMDYGEDTVFNLRYFAHCKSVWFDPACFYHYRRINEESLFGRFHEDTYEIHKMVYSGMRALMEANNCREEAMGRFDVLYFSLLVGGIHEYYRHSEKNTAAQRIQQIVKVAEDPQVSKVQWKYLKDLKNKILFVLFRCKFIKVIAAIFRRRYAV